ncbi:MAG: VanZ family protein [Massilia sp.]
MSSLFSLLMLDPAQARRRLACAFALFTGIIVFGSIPGARAEIGNFASGLVLHGCAYAGICALLFTGYAGSANQRALKAVLTVALMGALDEIVQSFLPYRHGAVSDWMVDVGAALLAALLLRIFLPANAPRQAPR